MTDRPSHIARYALLFTILATTACSDPADAVPAASSADVTVAETQAPDAPAATEAEAPPPARGTHSFSNDGSTIQFTGSKVTGSHDGSFGDFAGSIDLSSDGITASSVNVTIQTASLTADVERLTNHLKSDDFFDVANIPTAGFSSTNIIAGAPAGPDGAANSATHTVTGNLTLHGQTRAITFPATISADGNDVRVQAEFSIDRTQFGLTYRGMEDNLIRNDVIIRLDINANANGG